MWINDEFGQLPCVSVGIDPSADRPLHRYGLEQLLRAAGVRYAWTESSPPDVYYGTDALIGAKAGVWIPATGGLLAVRSPQRPPGLIEVDGIPLPVLGDDPPPTAIRTQDRLGFDAASAVAFWLTLASEGYVSYRDAHGRVPAGATLLATGGCLDRPPVQIYTRLLTDCLEARGVCARFAPRWPAGKRYAVALTHDVDAPERPGRVRALLSELLRGGRRRPRRHAYWDLLAEVRRRGLLDGSKTGSTDQRGWDFAEFCELERRHDLRSAFNFAVVSREKGHPLDVAYDVGQPKYRRLMGGLIEEGWEVGLHAAYLTAEGNPVALAQYWRLAALAGCNVRGGRHHYLRLEPEQPLCTLSAHAKAGAEYDSSMAFNDSPGFRAGTALPFEVFDPHRGSAGNLLELAMSLADMHLSRDNEQSATERVMNHLATVRELGGLAVLDWHVGNWHTAPGWRESYRAACKFLASDAEAWVAPPWRIAAWWAVRSCGLQGGPAISHNINSDRSLELDSLTSFGSRTTSAW